MVTHFSLGDISNSTSQKTSMALVDYSRKALMCGARETRSRLVRQVYTNVAHGQQHPPSSNQDLFGGRKYSAGTVLSPQKHESPRSGIIRQSPR